MEQEMQNDILTLMQMGATLYRQLNDSDMAMTLAEVSILIRAYVQKDELGRNVWEKTDRRAAFIMLEPLVAASQEDTPQVLFAQIIDAVETNIRKNSPADVAEMAISMHLAAAFFHLVHALGVVTESDDFAMWEHEFAGQEN